MDTLKKGNFVTSFAGEKHFDKDLELFKKTFPNKTALIAEFEKAEPFMKKAYDERILMELLDADGIEAKIHANRKPVLEVDKPESLKEQLEKLSIKNLKVKYPDVNQGKNKAEFVGNIIELVEAKALQTLKDEVQKEVDAYISGTDNATEETATEAVNRLPEDERTPFVNLLFQHKQDVAAEAARNSIKGDETGSDNSATAASGEADKKKEDHEQSTQE